MPFRSSGRGAYGPQGQRVIKGPLAPVWVTFSPPAGTAAAYSYQFVATDDSGDAPTYSLASGSLPPGLTLSSSGLLSGTPSTAGTFTFNIRATDINGRFTDSGNLTITVTLTPTGGTLYQSVGSYTWTAPANVTSVSVVVIGGGAGSSGGGSSSFAGVLTANGGSTSTSAAGGTTLNSSLSTGTVSGGNGGAGNTVSGQNKNAGGAGGYGTNGEAATATGSCGNTNNPGASPYGGSGLVSGNYGRGAASCDGGSSNGYGGGALRYVTSYAVTPGQGYSVSVGGAGSGGGHTAGQSGAVRIIWGTNRAFPNTNTAQNYNGFSETVI